MLQRWLALVRPPTESPNIVVIKKERELTKLSFVDYKLGGLSLYIITLYIYMKIGFNYQDRISHNKN